MRDLKLPVRGECIHEIFLANHENFSPRKFKAIRYIMYTVFYALHLNFQAPL